MLVAPAGTGNRSFRKTCSERCRTRVSARRKLARDLHNAGTSVRAIAKQLNLEVQDVKNLIS